MSENKLPYDAEQKETAEVPADYLAEDVLNRLASAHSYTSILEIGIEQGVTAAALELEDHVGVDPDPMEPGRPFTSFMGTSDAFFAQNNRQFDLVFVDGLHDRDQVLRDVENSLACLSDGGTIVLHDICPFDELSQRVPRVVTGWVGDVWKAWVDLRQSRPDLEMMALEKGYGFGLIRPGQQTTIQRDVDLTYESYLKYKDEWIGFVTEDVFFS